jgi:hypothetical protein
LIYFLFLYFCTWTCISLAFGDKVFQALKVFHSFGKHRGCQLQDEWTALNWIAPCFSAHPITSLNSPRHSFLKWSLEGCYNKWW